MTDHGARPAPPRAVVLDTDGVLIDSAAVHAAAWKTAFDGCLPEWADGAGNGEPFDADADYRRYVDGRSRYEGAASFLAARGIRLPAGAPDDLPGCDTVRAVAARKEQAFRDALRARPVTAFQDASRALAALRSLSVPTAAVSASRHARALLASAGTDRLLTTVVDGEDAAGLGLAGKPDPALFLHAAHVLGVRPQDCAVVEDALAGVLAGRRGRFGLVVGVDRTPDRHTTDALREHGAHLVVTDLMQCVEAAWGAVP
ncbi:hydrolase [Streptomyces sp. NE5-10]|uniref:HAD family hydrolase n=1 Tax=Streptomyces sp. NE5-10 TaxID=2759674 RepID=UPI0019036E9D|nr:HAD-IA family hydrolase [Streptomyces sp. NE5-10]GHJ96889.1 hydrolase [Streptomyces sp. NE5-10]